MRRGLQNEDASFNITSQNYDEKYAEHKSTLAILKMKDVNPEMYRGGSFDAFGDRKTLLGKNM